MTQDPLFPYGPGPGPDPRPGPGEEEVPDPLFPRVEDWLTYYFLPVYRRYPGGQFRWCRKWWAHDEAITILTSLWRTWEVCRLEPATGMADWQNNYLYPLLGVLLSPSGPFYRCSTVQGHEESDQLPVDPPPAGVHEQAA